MQLIGKRSHDDEPDIEADRRSSSHETLAEEYDEYAPLQTLTDNELVLEKQLRKRIDRVILPMVFFVYLLNGIDRSNIAAARLQGLEDDLNLVDDQYQTALAIFSVGYTLIQIPSNLALNYVGRPSIYLGFFVVAWGLVSALTSQATNFVGLVVCRVVLGLVEGPFFAGVLFYLSKWYTKKELALRGSIFYSGTLISAAFGSLIAAGISSGLDGVRGLDPWQWLYIIEGSVTCLAGLILIAFMPDFPETWKVLTPELREVAIRRMKIESTSEDVDEPGIRGQLRGLRMAVEDPKTWVFGIMYMSFVGAASFSNFFPTLTETLGYSNIISLLLVAPPYIFVVIWAFIHARISDAKGLRFWFVVYPVPISIAGLVIFMVTNNFGSQYFSLFLMVICNASFGTVYSWLATSIARPPAKRAAAYAILNMLGNSATIWTPFTYPADAAPHYIEALSICIGLLCLATVCAVIMRWILQRQNNELRRIETSRSGSMRDKKEGGATSTIRPQRGFRYLI